VRVRSGYLCKLTDNVYGIEFLSFKVRNMANNQVLFEVSRDPNMPTLSPGDLAQLTPEEEDSVRCISYDFGPDFLRLEAIGTQLEFAVGGEPVPNFRMIERHYFRDELIKSYDFVFGFCIPNSTNSWEAIYEVPPLREELIKQMVDNPFETESDSFYFVNDKMIMHNKAKYAYTRGT